MSALRPLVITDDPATPNAGQPLVQQLPTGADLDIPLDERVQMLAAKFSALVIHLVALGIDVPEELLA